MTICHTSQIYFEVVLKSDCQLAITVVLALRCEVEGGTGSAFNKGVTMRLPIVIVILLILLELKVY